MTAPDLFAPERATTVRLLAGILDAVALGLDEAGMPLTPEQRAFFVDAAESPLR
jgi:hypothetical protein